MNGITKEYREELMVQGNLFTMALRECKTVEQMNAACHKLVHGMQAASDQIISAPRYKATRKASARKGAK